MTAREAEPTAYDFITTQLARIEGKLDRQHEVFLGRTEYEKRHEEILRAIQRGEADNDNGARILADRVKVVEDNFTKLLWAVGGTVSVTLMGIVVFLIQGHIHL